MGELIAEGGSGRVYKAEWRKKTAAVKEFSESMLSFSPEEFQREVAIMRYITDLSLPRCPATCIPAYPSPPLPLSLSLSLSYFT